MSALKTQILPIITQFFAASNIADARILKNRVIVQIKNTAEDENKVAALKQAINKQLPQYKVTVVFIAEQNNNMTVAAIEKWRINAAKKIIGIASAKGGVGKSTTAVNLALALADLGQRVALVDADIYGPSVPTMLGYEGEPMRSVDGEHFEPFLEYGIQSVSIGSLIDKNTPLIWRGSKAVGALKQLLEQTNWNNVDVMVLDMPPGTGDILISLAQHINFAGIVIVSTPQDVALIDAVKGVQMFKKIGAPILGIVENMSYFKCPHCGEKIDIFGHEGAKKIARDLNVDFLGEIELDLGIRNCADNGTPIVAAAPDSVAAKSYANIAAKIAIKI